MENVHQSSDKGYKSILEHKQTFIELLKSFVKESWVNEIEEDNLEYVNNSFILRDYKDKEADILYRMKVRDREVIFYVLLELQSSVDYTMPFRLLLYMTEIWRQEFYNTDNNVRERKDYKLPAIIPIVLYNGAKQWTAYTSFKNMQAGNELFGKHILDFEHILIDVNRYNDVELYEIGNMISSVFLLEQKVDSQEFIKRFYKLVHFLKALSPEQWARFKRWIINIIIPKFGEEVREKLDKIIEDSDIGEVEKMVSNIEIMLDEMVEKAEIKGKLDVVKKALTKGLPVETIAEITGLTVDKIKDIQKEIMQ